MLLSSMIDVSFGYRDVPCLQNASIEIHSWEFVAVTGPNGASKTTLLKLALGLLQPWEGKTYLSVHNQEGHDDSKKEDPAHKESTLDPHVWLDPVLAQKWPDSDSDCRAFTRRGALTGKND